MTTTTQPITTMPNQRPTDAEWRQKYDKHLKSARWKNIRRDLFRLRGAKCEVCGKPSPTLEIHHLNYDRLGMELPSDLKIVCKICHEEEDRKRERVVMIKREVRQRSSAFDTWFFKRTGMSSAHATEVDAEQFQQWLEQRREGY